MSESSPYKTLSEGIPSIKDAFVIVIRTQWNDTIVSELESGCMQILNEHAIDYRCIQVPGAFEIPFAVKHLFETTKIKPHAFIALGCIIRGDTPHFDFVSKAVTDGILHLNLFLGVPTIFGVLTVDNEVQAQERIGGKHGHKGKEAALTALQMIRLTQELQ